MNSKTPSAPEISKAPVFMPPQMKVLMVLYWAGGLSGLVLGVLLVNEGIFETHFIPQALLVLQGILLAALGGSFFLIATGIVTGAKWAVATLKNMIFMIVPWSIVELLLGGYLASSASLYVVTVYEVAGWLLIFGIGTGLLTARYLRSEVSPIGKYVELVTTEPLEREIPRAPLKQLPTKSMMARCIECGTTLELNAVKCKLCGANQLQKK